MTYFEKIKECVDNCDFLGLGLIFCSLENKDCEGCPVSKLCTIHTNGYVALLKKEFKHEIL